MNKWRGRLTNEISKLGSDQLVVGNDEIVRNSSKLSNLNIWKDSDATRNERSEMALALSGMGRWGISER